MDCLLLDDHLKGIVLMIVVESSRSSNVDDDKASVSILVLEMTKLLIYNLQFLHIIEIKM